MKHRDSIAIDKLISECHELNALKEGHSIESFLKDERTKRAICMTLINIGELVKSLTDETRKEYNNIPWRQIAGLRDIAAHKYRSLMMEDVWKTAEDDVPALLENLLEIRR
jgi:uncharacterized protein with HEPN domain